MSRDQPRGSRAAARRARLSPAASGHSVPSRATRRPCAPSSTGPARAAPRATASIRGVQETGRGSACGSSATTAGARVAATPRCNAARPAERTIDRKDAGAAAHRASTASSSAWAHRPRSAEPRRRRAGQRWRGHRPAPRAARASVGRRTTTAARGGRAGATARRRAARQSAGSRSGGDRGDEAGLRRSPRPRPSRRCRGSTLGSWPSASMIRTRALVELVDGRVARPDRGTPARRGPAVERSAAK